MKVRIIAGVIAAALLILLIYKGSVEMILLVVGAMATGGYLEFDRLFMKESNLPRQLRMITITIVSLVLIRENNALGWVALWGSFVFLGVFHLVRADHSGDFQKSTNNFAVEVVGYLYVLSLFAFIVPIVELPNGRDYIMLLFLIVFLGDTAAYFVGTQLGKHKLATKLSPKKSIEGAAAGLVVSVIAAFLWLQFLSEGYQERGFEYGIKIMAFAPLASILAQLGDLFESMFKRSQAQKDSGTFLPGHGGVLDRVDGLALVSPVFYFYLVWVLER